MKITSIDAVAFQLPVRRDFRWAGLQVGLGGFVLVRVHTDMGLVGYGEATPLPDWGGDFGRHGGETQATVIAIVTGHLGPALLGHNPTNVTAAMATMNRVVVGHSYAKCAIDIALHDVWGKALGVPVYKLLGGAVRESVPIAHMVGLMPDEEGVAEAVDAVSDGVKALQIKGGENAARDIRLIRRLRDVLGEGVTLRLDANQGFRHVKTAIATIHALEGSGLDWIEQPVMGLPHMAEVTRRVPVRVIADESCWDCHDALELVQARAADAISIYLAKAGGFQSARKVATIAESAGLPCDVNGSIESGIGNAANLHFSLATPSVEIPAVIPVSAPRGRHPYSVAGNYYDDDIIVDPFPVADGCLLPLDKPGLGIDVDEQKVEQYRCG